MIRRLVILASPLLALLVQVGPVGADPVVPIPMQVRVTHTSSSFSACGYGTAASATNAWVLHVQGVRASNASPIINETIIDFRPTFDYCIPIPKLNATAGAIVVTFTYAGTGPDVTGTFGGWGLWAPNQPDESGDTGIGDSVALPSEPPVRT